MEIKLSPEEYNFLMRDGFLTRSLQKEIREKHRSSRGFFTLDIDEETADKVREIASEKLMDIGFDKNYEPTNEGKILEIFIDKFYIDQ